MSDGDWGDGGSDSVSTSFGRGGRGRGRGRGGGYNNRANDDDSYGSGSRVFRNSSRGGGGGGGRYRDDGDEPTDYDSGFSSRRSGGRRGGFSGFDNEESDGGFVSRGSRGGGFNEQNGGGFGSRRGGFGRSGGFADENSGGFGGRRGGGGGFGRSGGFDDENSGGFRGRGRDQDNDDGFGHGGGRGGSRRGGRHSDGGDDFGKGSKPEEEKPRERYIPPEPTDDENVLFSSGTCVGINFDKYEDIKIKVSGENPVAAAKDFDSCGLRPFVLGNVKKSGYTVPTPVQKNAIPIIMAGRDLMACAQTGSGKTAAFLVPIINALLEDPQDPVVHATGVEPQVIILSPTRELAIQICQEGKKFAHGSMLKVCIAYGGTAVYNQAQIIMRGCHILVATPGRLNDFVNRGRVLFNSVRFFVLDEADRMLDMGFLPEVEKMLCHDTMPQPTERQTLMFSATFPPDIQRLAAKYFNNYLFLAVGIVGGACADVQQTFFEVPRFEKRDKLAEVLRENGGKELTLVFVEQKRNADFVATHLSENNFPTTSIHGDRLQSQREAALADFRSGRMPTMIATGVASRGLDIKNVAHVINYDLPNSIDEYVHRIGRTGRVGNRGKATSFFDPEQDSNLAGELIKILTQCNQEVPAFLSGMATGGGGFSNRDSFGGRDVRKGNQWNEGASGGAEDANNVAVADDDEGW